MDESIYHQINGYWLRKDDRVFSEYLAEEGHEAYAQELMETALGHVKRWDVAVDGGAHIGSWSRPLSRKFHTVVSFEPHRENFSLLSLNVPAMNCIKIMQGLGHVASDFSLHEGHNTGANFMVPGNEVRVIALPDFGALDFIKLDVEGFEYYALLGALPQLQKYSPVVVIEDKKYTTHSYPDSGDPQALLRSLGYTSVAKTPNMDFVYVRK